MSTSESIPRGPVATEELTFSERALAFRNHGLPMEAMRYDTTPIGLHYLLIHYDIPRLDAADWRLDIGGLVERSLSLSLDDLRSRPAVTRRLTFECAGNGRTTLQPRALSVPWGVEAVGTAEWTGTTLAPLLEEAGLRPEAIEIVFTGADSGVEKGVSQHYARSLTVSEATRNEVLLVYGMNGQPLPPQHGFPVRLLVPGWYGMTNVKWLRTIAAVDTPFDGFQHQAYRLRADADDPGIPVERIRPRSLMVPPGVPDFFTRERSLAAGPVTLEGRAWSGTGRIERVELTLDGGATWTGTALGPQPDPYAWVCWSARWEATPGEHLLGCRATNELGESQPLAAEWNLGGFACNGVDYMSVTVT